MSSEVPQQSPPGGFSVSMAGDVDAAFYRQTAHISEEEARSEVSTEALGKVSSKLVGGTVQVPLRRHTERETASERRPQYISASGRARLRHRELIEYSLFSLLVQGSGYQQFCTRYILRGSDLNP